MKHLFFALFAIATLIALSPVPAHAWPWSTDMMNQPSQKPQEGLMHPFPRRSVPVTGIPTKVADRDEAEDLVNPVEANPRSIGKGRTLFKIYCSACHGITGRGDTPVAELIGTVDLTDPDMVDDLTDGWIFGTITFGSAIMPAYGVPNEGSDGRGSNDLDVEERWHVVNYIRNGLVADAEMRTRKAEQ
ncbi:MAG: c-type cytochrome [Rhodospirillales bacterium]|nr:c-type cytochrome [Rhodospirillales bacterium]